MQWRIKPQKFDGLVEQLLINRGLKTESQKQEFFHPKLEDFESDLQIRDLKKTNDRIQKAIKDQELIIAYGDYDVDGIAGAAVLYLGLTRMGAKVLPYIPHREKEGYGLSRQGLEFARDSGASLVITTDTGIVAIEMAEYAKELGLDLIITDHHQPMDTLPDAFAIVHSLKLCGAGVSWCLIRDNELLDLVALATISDMMELVGVNRAIVKAGLKKLNVTSRVGLLALFREADLKLGEIGAYEIGHIIAPRLNAMGRLEHAIDSLRLLCTKDQIKARKLADLVGETNETRKILTSQAVDEAKKMVVKGKNINVLSSKNWASGIIGLVAGRVCDETGLSTVAIAVGEQYSKGSARAANGDNIVKLLRECEDLLEAVGGHTSAAGFTIQTKRIPEFQKKLESLVITAIREEPVLEIEAEVKSKDLNLSLINKLENFEPFGIGNNRPTLATFNMKLSGLRTVGDGKHLKGKADDIDFIGFGMGNKISVLENGQLANLAYTLEIDKFNGSEKLQLKLRDLQSV